MTPEQAAADLKALELKAADNLVSEIIPKKYFNYKQAKISLLGDLAYQYQNYITSARNVVSNSSDGKSSRALLDVLNQLIQEDGDLLSGVGSISFGPNFVYWFSQLDSNIRAVNNFFEGFSVSKVITLLDDFLKSKNKLIYAIPVLSQLQKENNQLLGGLEAIFEEVIIAVAAILPHVSYPEVKAIAVSRGLQPIDNIKLDMIEKTNKYIVKATRTIEKTINDVQKFYDDFHGVDDYLSKMFNKSGRWIAKNLSNPLSGLSDGFDFLGTLSTAFDKVSKGLSKAGGKISKLFKGLAGGLKTFVENPAAKAGSKILGLAGNVLDGFDDYYNDIDAGRSKEFAAAHGTTKAVAETAGTIAGEKAGAALGAVVGSAFPIVGTAVGAAVGGFLGGLIGNEIAKKAVDAGADAIEKNSSSAKNKPKPA